ncbi:AMP-binding protein [Syntrophus aciditrophicus]|uniref:2-aminobenzoate-CoA ligase n=1 Tax=Syntrophus aciditrophicus (strain SB) TaxID=56780 RepID=Q2LXD1_SYNAS|nr:AMP-binding protein [Syntrophus aciditrophicus]ABC78739.1 2-aminobenzoate-CoA ligase [Syntrophus aciditrophicus SB]OPY14047.1 MAG: Benzoate--CoA ligase [Syntrophus sp. PtaB.Bin075]
MNYTGHIDRFVRENLPPEDQLPEFIFETPELQFPEHLNATALLLDKALEEGAGERIAMIGKDIRWTYRDLQSKVNQLASLLTEDMGLIPGNRVLLRGGNTPWFAVCWLAVWKAGGVAVGTMPLLRAKELKQLIHLGRVSHALCEASLAEELNLARPECPELKEVMVYGDDAFDKKLASKSAEFNAVDTASDDPALIAFTSGTTGIPKGCIHLHRDVMAMCEVVCGYWLKPSADDVFIGTPPLAFTFGLGGLLCFPLWARASTVLMEKLSPPVLIGAIEQYGATITFTAPTGYRQMTPLIPQHNITSLKKSVSAGEALSVDTRKKWREATGIEMHDGIGGTELIHIYLAAYPDDYREGSLGKPLPGYRAMLVDEQMNPVPVGETGKLAVKGPTGCRYLADERQKSSVRNGWTITGDAYHQDSDGYYYFHARVDDIIVTSGYNVSSPEVESVLLEHPAVSECGVIGIPDPDRGQVLKAFIVLKPGYTGDESMVKTLQDFVKQNAAPYKYPRVVEFVTALPRTETGKLQRFKLK